MAEQMEARIERATPAQWIERLEIFRERFRLGLMDTNAFNDIIRCFQFTDDVGHVWMPGATSNQWYRWDRTRWTSALPPQRLAASNIPIALALTWNRDLVAPIAMNANLGQGINVPTQTEPPRVRSDVRVSAPIAKETNRGQDRAPIQMETPSLEINPAPVEPAPPPAATPALTRATCPHCGQAYIAPAKFCPNCGNLLTGERVVSPPTSVPKKPARPTDLPERGTTRSRSKPTDLPR